MIQCRICFSHEPQVHERNHDLVCCRKCHDWVARQPVYFPPGTARNLCGLETVQWWDLQDLYACNLTAKDVAQSPLTIDQVVASVRKLLVETVLRPKGREIQWDEALVARVSVRGGCVEFAVPYQGLVENEVEQILSTFDIKGRR